MTNSTRYQTKADNPQIVKEPTCFTIHVTRWIDNFTRRFGRKIKRVCGSYSSCRGRTTTRYVKIPNTPNGREIADAVIAANIDSRSTGEPTTVMLSGVAATMPAWVTVHDVTSTADALAKFHNALNSAADRGIIERFEGKTECEKMAKDCPVCGGDGWTDGSAELRRDGRSGDTTCIECDGAGVVDAARRGV